jgi:hypothetical protein
MQTKILDLPSLLREEGQAMSIWWSVTPHRGEGVVRVTAAMMQVVAQLDALEQRLSPMEYIGTFGAATDLIHLALAMEVASAENHVVLLDLQRR